MKSDGIAYPKLSPNLQVSFYERLKSERGRYLGDALAKTVQVTDISSLDKELHEFVEANNLAKLASAGLRGEVFFPVPYLLYQCPNLLGYYRLLYGISQKTFYGSRNFGSFRCLEEENRIPVRISDKIQSLCLSLIYTGGELLDSIDEPSLHTVNDLQLLTLGAQFRGTQNTVFGKTAWEQVLQIIERIVADNITSRRPRKMTLTNAAGRLVTISSSPDPDITIIEEMPSGPRPLVSVEIKGGKDVSNVHNRIGEAEKSHQKAKEKGFFEFWTIIGARVDLQVARSESPTTGHFFMLDKLLETNSYEFAVFSDRVRSVLGIKDTSDAKKPTKRGNKSR